jgi:ferritin-like metal-binding protein YciE
MDLKDFNELFVHELQDIASFEQQLVDALPKMAKAAQSPELREALESHLEETSRQLKRVQELLASINGGSSKVKCAGMAGIIKEGEEVNDITNANVRDAAIICAAQRVEHYEMAAYGTARAHAELLAMSEAATVLEEILDEEKAADEKLTELSRMINVKAEVKPGNTNKR